jgi:hypothetical protein
MQHKANREDFLDALFGNYWKRHHGFVLVKTYSRAAPRPNHRYFPSVETLAREQYGREQHVLFGVVTRERMKPDKDHIKYLTALWSGLDIGPDGYSGKTKHFSTENQALSAVAGFPLKPSIVINSGRGFHIYWLLKEVLEIKDPEHVENILTRINEYFQCSSLTGLDATLRLPDTTNPRGAGHGVACSIRHFDPSLQYELSQFEDLDLRIIIPSKKSPKLPPPVTASPAGKKIRIVREPKQAEQTAPTEAAQASSGLEPSAQPGQDAALSDPTLPGPAAPAHQNGAAPAEPPKPTPAPSENSASQAQEAPSPGGSHESSSSPRDAGVAGGPVFLDEEALQKLADKLLEGISGKLLETLADRIVDKLMQKASVQKE